MTENNSTLRTKRIAIRYYSTKEYIKTRKIEIEYIVTRDQIADIFTKPLPVKQFDVMKSKLRIRDLTLMN